MPPSRQAVQPPEVASRSLRPASTLGRPKKEIFIPDSHLSDLPMAESDWTNENQNEKNRHLFQTSRQAFATQTERSVSSLLDIIPFSKRAYHQFTYFTIFDISRFVQFSAKFEISVIFQ